MKNRGNPCFVDSHNNRGIHPPPQTSMNDLPPRFHRALTLLSTLLLPVAISVALSSRVSAQTLPSDPQPSCTVSPSTVAGWFQGGKPVLNGVVSPVDSTALDTSTNCNF